MVLNHFRRNLLFVKHPQALWVNIYIYIYIPCIYQLPLQVPSKSIVKDTLVLGSTSFAYQRVHFGVDEHPFATYFDVHQGYRVLTHSHIILVGVQGKSRRNFKRNQLDGCLPLVVAGIHWQVSQWGQARQPPFMATRIEIWSFSWSLLGHICHFCLLWFSG